MCRIKMVNLLGVATLACCLVLPAFLCPVLCLLTNRTAALAHQQSRTGPVDGALSGFPFLLFTALMWDTFSPPAGVSRWMAEGVRVFPCHLLIICMGASMPAP